MSPTDSNIFTAGFSTHLPFLFLPPIVLATAIFFILFLSLILLRTLLGGGTTSFSRMIDLPPYDETPSSILRQKATRKQLKEMSGKIDCVVIGSGIGALSTAVMLAKAGYKVVVFEKHSGTVGGSSQTFDHKGFEFDVGVHYIGGGQSTRRMFEYLSDGQLKFVKMNSTYDVAFDSSTGTRIEFTDDQSVNRKNLLAAFPHLKEEALNTYDRACLHARRTSWLLIGMKLLPPFLLRIIWPFLYPIYKKYAIRPAMEIMKEECGLPDDVVGALSYHWGDIGTTPGKSS